uniref:Phospholipase B-like n=1 Tax=Petromyzon marinus TaxID=7757 RepID=A0AAJ7X6J9_PETMA|nr:phospholipase B-like 1 [Petromyzon marinus]
MRNFLTPRSAERGERRHRHQSLAMKDVKKKKRKAGTLSCVAAVMLLCCAQRTDADYTTVTLYVSGNPRNPDVALGKLDPVGGAAYGTLNDSLLSTGWAELEVRSGYGGGRGAIGDSDVAFLAGYVEGYLTARHINNHFKNLYPTFIKDNKTHAILEDFLRKQDSWARVQSRENHNDPFWRNVDYVLSQLDGMIAGATRRNAEHGIKTDLSFPALYLNAVGDVIDLVNALVPSRRPPWLSLSKAEAKRLVQKSGHCSALIKILPGYENIFMSHSSWFTYAATMRIFKHWDLNILDASTASRQMSFSSYPGFLESLDDYYLLSSGLVLLQTTNNVFNDSLYAAITPLSLLAWQRVRVANMMARGGRQWGQVFARHNSGTYNNQYMVLDLKKIELKKNIADEALFVVEQIPTLVVSEDQTDILRKGYWPSYNVPFYESVYNLSGYPEFVATHGSDFSYELAPRAKIFRRDHGSVVDLASMKGIMRSNNYKYDPYSEGDPCDCICCRGDLNPTKPAPDGCYDTKVTDYFNARNFTSFVVNGPTVQPDTPPFSWSKFNGTSHVGLPPMYDFPFVTVWPATFTATAGLP